MAFGVELKEYCSLKLHVNKLNLTLEQFELVKLLFKDEINSVRRFYSTTNIDELLDILERRALLSERRFEPIERIAKYLKNTQLETLVNDYRKFLEDNNLLKDRYPNINIYGNRIFSHNSNELNYLLSRCIFTELEAQAAGSLLEQEYKRFNKLKQFEDEELVNDDDDEHNIEYSHLSESIQQSPSLAPSKQSSPTKAEEYTSTSPITYDQQRAIFNLLTREIGKKWRDFGRGLELAEGDLDEIELKFSVDLKSRILEILKRFANDNSESIIFLQKLMNALTLARRNDLKREILKHIK